MIILKYFIKFIFIVLMSVLFLIIGIIFLYFLWIVEKIVMEPLQKVTLERISELPVFMKKYSKYIHSYDREMMDLEHKRMDYQIKLKDNIIDSFHFAITQDTYINAYSSSNELKFFFRRHNINTLDSCRYEEMYYNEFDPNHVQVILYYSSKDSIFYMTTFNPKGWRSQDEK